ncbi:MAG: T9SS type A sorting domain-containing protein [Candidatus Cloacimonetes bacterium]|nr:T9SS type A sorting domain-containing protein [Candidatus Cloacimonadota bacterium]
MKRMIMVMIMLSIFFLIWGQFIWEEPGVWADQERMIYVDEFNVNLVSISTEDGLIAVWVESLMGVGQIFGQKFTIDGEPLWDEPIQFTDGNMYPCLHSGIADEDGNLIIVYYLSGDTGFRLQKRDGDGVFLWETEIAGNDDFYYELCLKSGSETDFYLGFKHTDADTYFENVFYHFEENGAITEGWENGLTYGSSECNFWSVDNNGEMVTYYLETGMDLVLQRINQQGEEAFPEPVLVFEDAIIIPFLEKPALAFTPDGDYLCGSGADIKLVSQEGEIVWEFTDLPHSSHNITGIVPGEDYFYVYTEYGEIYQFDYEPSALWVIENERDIEKAWILADDGIRFIDKDYVLYEERQEHKLNDYDSGGNQLSPDEGWFHCTEYEGCYKPVYLESAFGETIWIMLRRDEDIQQELSFVTIEPSGTLPAGDIPVTIRTGTEQMLVPLEIYVNEDMEAILMMHKGFPQGGHGSKIVLQRLDRDGLPLGDGAGQVLFPAHSQLICSDENLVFFFTNCADDRSFHLVDMETGEHLWGEEGIPFPPEFTSNVVSGGISEGVVTYFWSLSNGENRLQRIANGEEVFQPGGILVELNGVACCGAYLRDQYLINVISGSSVYRVTSIGDNGEVNWSVNCGHSLYYDAKENHKLTGEGLLVLFQANIWPPGALRCQLLNETGGYVYGEGITILPEFNEDIYGLVVFEGGFGVISNNNNTNGEPANYCSFNMDSSVLQEEIALTGTENCLITSAVALEGGIAVLMTEPDGLFSTLKTAYYDFNGNLQNTGGDNPFTCYEGFSHNEAVAANSYDNDVYFCWQSLLNSPESWATSQGNDVIMQGWRIPEVGFEGDKVPIVNINLELMPNPFNPELRISWSLAEGSYDGSISIYNVKGQKVFQENLAENQGYKIWQGNDLTGNKCGSGVYFVRLQSGEEEISRKALLLK